MIPAATEISVVDDTYLPELEYLSASHITALGFHFFMLKNILYQSAISLMVIALILAGRGVFAQECPSASYKRSSQTPIVRDMVNPYPYEGDFELPMPCGGKLFLRHVCIPAKSFLEDLQLNLGCLNCRRRDEGFMEVKHPAPLAGTLTLEDLPESWRNKLIDRAKSGDGQCPGPDDDTSNAFYYFIGKYEISNWQWQTVMSDDCPGWDEPFTSDDPRPKTNISWFEAVEFTRRYTEWLMKNAPESLPHFPDERYGYIRLPTEAEWEYAARGGHMVTDSQMNQQEFFPLNDRPVSDYAVYTPTGAAKPPERLAWIGTKCPNPLGLFDTAGNAAEMMLDPFRFSLGSRLHGASGGFVIKGGSFRKSKEEVMPGRREEMPFFLVNDAFLRTDVGFRVVLSGIITPRNRTQSLRQQWADVYKKHAPFRLESEIAESGSEKDADRELLNGLERLIGETVDESHKRTLLSVLAYLRNERQIPAENEAEAIEIYIWKALFDTESLITHTLQQINLQNELDTSNMLKMQSLPESEIEILYKKIANLKKKIIYHRSAIDYFAQSYVNSIENFQKFSEKDVKRKIHSILDQYQSKGSTEFSLKARLSLLERHIDWYYNRPENINAENIIKDIALAAIP